MKYLLTFSSTSFAMIAKRQLKKLDVVGEVVPVPRSLSAACAYAVEVRDPEISISSMLEGLTEKPGNVFSVEGKGRNVNYTKLEF